MAKSAIVLAMSGLCLSACAESSPEPSTGTTYTNLDRDGDGAPNTLDPYPDLANTTDWDADGIANTNDLRPYTAGTVQTDAVSGQTTPGSSGETSPSTPTSANGCPTDRDCDAIPDYKDPYPDIYDRTDTLPEDDDWDDDGLVNDYDSSPRNRDRDMDGKLDGYDPDPDNYNDGINEPTDNDPYSNDKDSDNDGFDDTYDSEPHDPYEQ